MTTVDLRHLDAHRYAQWLKEPDATLFVPVGAFEQHGPHLPMAADEILASHMARGVAESMAAMVAAPINYGYKSQQKSGGGDHLPGTVSLDAATLIGVTRSIVSSYLRQGLTRLVLLNGHYENYQFLYEGVDLALRDAGVATEGDAGPDAPAVLLLSYWDYVSDQTLATVYPDGFPGWDIEHGGVLETALMLHLQPELVELDRAPDHPAAQLPRFDRLPVVAERTPGSGCLSAPAGATAEKGRLLYEQVTTSIAADLRQEFSLPVA
ncbi:MAG: creatininase [Micrococcaceae bacterium]